MHSCDIMCDSLIAIHNTRLELGLLYNSLCTSVRRPGGRGQYFTLAHSICTCTELQFAEHNSKEWLMLLFYSHSERWIQNISQLTYIFVLMKIITFSQDLQTGVSAWSVCMTSATRMTKENILLYSFLLQLLSHFSCNPPQYTPLTGVVHLRVNVEVARRFCSRDW